MAAEFAWAEPTAEPRSDRQADAWRPVQGIALALLLSAAFWGAAGVAAGWMLRHWG